MLLGVDFPFLIFKNKVLVSLNFSNIKYFIGKIVQAMKTKKTFRKTFWGENRILLKLSGQVSKTTSEKSHHRLRRSLSWGTFSHQPPNRIFVIFGVILVLQYIFWEENDYREIFYQTIYFRVSLGLTVGLQRSYTYNLETINHAMLLGVRVHRVTEFKKWAPKP